MSLDDLEGLTWLRAQPEGRVAVNAAKLGRQWGWNRTRTSRRLKAWEQAGPIRRNAEAITVPGSVTPTVTEDTAAVTEAADVTRTSGAERERRFTTPVSLAAFRHWLVYRLLFPLRA
jgi:hypothetical protein